MAKDKKIRVDFTKNRQTKRRDHDLTRRYRENEESADDIASVERVRAKGAESRKRTIRVGAGDSLSVDEANTLRGRVLVFHGLYCQVVTEDGELFKCYTRRLLKSLQTDERALVATGDWVWFRPAPGKEGFILKVEPRTSVLGRVYRNREQVIAANVDQVLIVGSLVEPDLKVHLIDRYLVSAEQGHIEPVICLNKVDLVDPARYQPIVGMYSQLGYRIFLVSANSGAGIDLLREALRGRQTVVVGQSGVGKSSLLNSLEPRFQRKVREVSDTNQKGRHTTTASQLLLFADGGVVIDTPGIRQLELWQSETGAIDGFFVEFRPFVPLCKFQDCQHRDEIGCAIRQAVETGLISTLRYDSYIKLLTDEPA